ncbi:GGDEF domain-containing protein [Deinococcus sonorensis]|uniref:GGDEF domain-containing protein n=2 Tax=Deinococcus sonorensis TaxID=309891 RepID=A0AAU7U8Q7_9DEIO
MTPDSLTTNTWNSLQRKIFLVLGPVGALACVAALIAQLSSLDPLDAVALPLLAGLLSLISVLLAFQRLSVQIAIRTALAGISVYFLAALHHQFGWFVLKYSMLSENTYWFAVLYAISFVAFPPKLALRTCTVVFVLSVLICGADLLTLSLSGQLNYRMVAAVVQFTLASSVLIGAQFALGIMREQLDQVRLAAYIDVLTGLPNRRYAQQQLERRIQEGKGFALVMLDIDHFKQVNDTYGHEAGDMVLRETARVVSRHLSGAQFLARWGGEEFVLVLPGLHKHGGKALAEAARTELYQHVFDQVGGLTASFGVAEWVAGESLETVMRRADAALYAAKRQGRNGVRVAMEDGRLTRLDLPAHPLQVPTKLPEVRPPDPEGSAAL